MKIIITLLVALFMYALILFLLIGLEKFAERKARFALDAMTLKQFDIDLALNEKRITKGEAKKQKEMLRKETNRYSEMDYFTKLLLKIYIFLGIVFFVAAVLILVLKNIW